MPSNDLASPRSVKLQLPSTVEEKVEETPVADINEEIKKHITENKPKRKTNFRDSINRPKIQADTPHCLTSKKLFERLEIIDKFVGKCKINKLGPSRYTGRLYTICRALKIHPKELVTNFETTEQLFTDFESLWDKINPGKTTEEYRKAVRKFLTYNNITIMPHSKAIPATTDSKGDYSRVHLTNTEFTQGLDFIERKAGFEYKALYAIMHEMFPRPETLYGYTPNIEIQYAEVDGKSYPYGETEIFEKKQKKYYDKIILDPRVLKITSQLKKDVPICNKPNKVIEKTLSVVLRDFYKDIGKITEGAMYKKGIDGWLYTNRPIYTLRHSAAMLWMSRTNFNATLVSKLGWEDPKTLSTYYAKTTVKNIMQSGTCYYCRPPQTKTNMAVFCSPTHALAYYFKVFNFA